MAKDPAFLFYPGDYLRDTQCLSERVQVAYDRIMCEHMRNICISQDQLNFFTKRLTPDEKSELLMVMTKKDCGYQIEWVAESISKRKDYSESRRINRSKKDISHVEDMLTYVPHMENEIENVNENKKATKKEKGYDRSKLDFPWSSDLFMKAWDAWLEYKRSQWKFVFASANSEQVALHGLLKKSNGVESVALQIISNSIENGWKGLFALDEKKSKPQQTQADTYSKVLKAALGNG